MQLFYVNLELMVASVLPLYSINDILLLIIAKRFEILMQPFYKAQSAFGYLKAFIE